ncbi:MAG: hypothetical protein ABIN37_11375 [Burkholderiaceae bacterium]
MQIYYPSLQAIDLQTRQLDHELCRHCRCAHQLVSHGFVYKKSKGAEPQAVGKRVFCSNRGRFAGCGRTSQLYLDAVIRKLRYTGEQLVAFMLALIQGVTVQRAYSGVTGTADPRHAYRWLTRLYAQLSTYRSLAHQAPLPSGAVAPGTKPAARRDLLGSTFRALSTDFGASWHAHYQRKLQRPFV